MNEQKQTMAGPWDGAEVISVYTRAQALEDGVLVDLTLCRARHNVSNTESKIMPSRARRLLLLVVEAGGDGGPDARHNRPWRERGRGTLRCDPVSQTPCCRSRFYLGRSAD